MFSFFPETQIYIIYYAINRHIFYQLFEIFSHHLYSFFLPRVNGILFSTILMNPVCCSFEKAHYLCYHIKFCFQGLMQTKIQKTIHNIQGASARSNQQCVLPAMSHLIINHVSHVHWVTQKYSEVQLS